MSGNSHTEKTKARESSCLTSALKAPSESSTHFRRQSTNQYIIGILPGEGVGPEIIAVVRDLLKIIERHWKLDFDTRIGGAIGIVAERVNGIALSREVSDFCGSVFDDGGVLLCGPGGGRFVYELRSRFDLYYKFTPVRPFPSLRDTGALRPETVEGVDLVIVRENVSGIYFSKGKLTHDEATHHFRYGRDEIQRIIDVAARLAEQRSGRLTLAVKSAAVKEASQLWINVFNELVSGKGLQANVLEIDNANYQIIAAARNFDVLVTPNMLGDILSDGAALLLGSRGMSFSGNFSPSSAAVYQTAHGAAYDLAGTDTANPIGQILSAAMMLRESFGLFEAAAALEEAVEQTLAAGIRTTDIASKDSTLVGTREMGRHIAIALERHLTSGSREP